MPFLAMFLGKIDAVPKRVMISSQMDLLRVSPNTITLLHNSFSSIRANLVRPSTFDGWQCSRDSCWAAKSPSQIFLEGMVEACCTACLHSACIWGSWKEIKSNQLRAHLNESQVTMGNKIHPNDSEWAYLHLITEGTLVNGYPHTRKLQLMGGLNSHTAIKRIVMSHLEIVLSPRSK